LKEHWGGAIMEYLPMQTGDVEAIYSDIEAQQKDVRFKPDAFLERFFRRGN